MTMLNRKIDDSRIYAQCDDDAMKTFSEYCRFLIFYMIELDASLVLSKKVTLIGKNLPDSILLPKANFVAIDSHVFVLVHL